MRSPLIFAAILAVTTLGCETFQPRVCDRTAEGNPPSRYTGGTTVDGVYMTADWDGELLLFDKGQRYDLVHNLGTTPRWISSWLSFERFGTTDGGKLAEPAGNQAVVVEVNDEIIRIANDSCVDYWILVTAGAGGEPVSPP
ncbi:Hypothetical protein A7982_08238 [Minicystis rosea]|nr:Hypothetical protein A7982_08238 [Minicystis rosea]